MTLNTRKFPNLDRLNAFLGARIIGGADLRGVGGTPNPRLYLHGLTLHFTTPAKTITFAATPANAQYPLSLQDVKTQIEAAGGLKAAFLNGALVVWAPAGTIVLASDGTANPNFGFDDTASMSAKVVSAPGGATPTLVSIVPDVASNQFLVVTDE